MKITMIIAATTCSAACAAFSAPLRAAQVPAQPAPAVPAAAAPTPAVSPEQMGYLFGLTFGTQMHNVGITNEIPSDAVTRGINDALKGRAPTQPEMRELQSYVSSVREAAIAQNQQAAADFLAKNGKEKGVITTASGLQFKILNAGNKKAPAIKAADEVTVQYRGRLLDGSEFDSSYARGVPATFPVNGVIKGWQEALVLMKPGAKWQLWVPPALAYGAVAKPNIPAGSLLIFDVDLIEAKSINPVQPTPTTPPSAPPGTPGTPPPGSH